MNLFNSASRAIQPINKNVACTVMQSAGFDIDPVSRKQIPKYTTLTGFGNFQALNGDDLQQLAGLNIQSQTQGFYFYGTLQGVVHADEKGGDLVIIGSQKWRAIKILEDWPGQWAKAALLLMGNA